MAQLSPDLMQTAARCAARASPARIHARSYPGGVAEYFAKLGSPHDLYKTAR